MAAAATVSNATPPPSDGGDGAMMSDAAMAKWVAACLGFQPGGAGLDPGSLRTRCPEGRYGLWHVAGVQGRTDVCEYLKCKGLLDLIKQRDANGVTPLHFALDRRNEETARWMIDNGAGVNAVTNYNDSAFCIACSRMSPSFVEELAGKVAPEHLTMCNKDGASPMRRALINNPGPLAVVRMLILRGVPARPEDFPASRYGVPLLPRRRELLASLEADLHLNDRTFLGLFLAAGVHAPSTTPACTTTTATTTATTKRVRTQRPDGSWSDPDTVPCEPRLVVTATPTVRRDRRLAAARAENHLPKLRGFRNTEVRIGIAGFLGVREALDLKRLRAARDVVAALPAEENEVYEEEDADY